MTHSAIAVEIGGGVERKISRVYIRYATERSIKLVLKRERSIPSAPVSPMSTGLVVVVTGSSAGLGRAIAHGFAKRGARIGLLARNPEALNAAREECEALGGQALVLPTDVSNAEAVDAAATRVEEEFGPIDVWVNDAMVSVFSPVKEMEASDYKRVTDVLYLELIS